MAKEGYKTGGYRISDIYQGSYSSLTPKSEYVTAGSLGITTDPRSANILKEVSEKLSMGVKQIELATVSPETFDSIPKQYFKEVNRMAKLTGINVSLHGPVMDVAGMSQQGFSETSREAAERKVAETLLRSHELNPDGNITVNFHSAEGIPGSQFLPPSERVLPSEEEKEGRKYKRMIAVEKETGRLIPLETEKKYYPGKEKIEEKMLTPEKSIGMLNDTKWDNSLSEIEFNRVRAEEILKDVSPVDRELYVNWAAASRNSKLVPKDVIEQLNNLNAEQWEQLKKIHSAATYADQAMKSATGAFDKAFQNSSEEEKEFLSKISKQYGKILGTGEEGRGNLRSLDPKTQSEALFALINGLEKVKPEMYAKIEDFATEKSAQTFGNAAWQSYKQFRDKAPILVIENPPAGFALSTGEDIKNIVEASRKKFVENAMSPSEKGGLGMGEKEAERVAEKFIGATWDVGHINMLRKYGYSEKEIIEETKKVAPLVKHVHLSDNFGFEHTELPMGMGNVPLNEMMKKLGEKGFDAKKIIEAGAWWQHFRSPPFQESLEAMGSPIYGMKMAPYWNQAPGLYQGYFSGYGQMLPQINYETFGAGFSRLPSELGGQAAGAQGSRMSGRPME